MKIFEGAGAVQRLPALEEGGALCATRPGRSCRGALGEGWTCSLEVRDEVRDLESFIDFLTCASRTSSGPVCVKVNSYTIHDVREWRDLNCKLVVMVWRDIHWLPKEEAEVLLSRALPVCERLMRAGLDWDQDRDGLIENSGKPDQTFDSWVMSGPSAYCGGLWLAALASMADMADLAGQQQHGWR